MSELRGVVFDLYGTLITLDRSVFQKELPRRIGISRRVWADFVRRVLLLTDFDDRRAFIDCSIEEFEPADADVLREGALGLLDEEISSARAFPGVLTLLRFLKRRGLRLGLVSNLAAPYKEPCASLGLLDLFDVVTFSCQVGKAKPNDEIYLEHCRELGLAPEEILFVGDSMRNDVVAPRKLGMQSVRAANHGPMPEAIATSDLGWMTLDAEREPLLGPGKELELDGESFRVTSVDPVPDDQQGRYNLVSCAHVEDAEGQPRKIYFKRYLSPASAHVEAFTSALLRAVGLRPPMAGVVEDPEPLYWCHEAPGEKAAQVLELCPELARDIGRHGASAFLFSNADLRPRNAFLVQEDTPRLVMVDYEHCLFNVALDVSGIDDPLDPRVLDALEPEEFDRRIKKKVLSPAAMRRTYKAFFRDRGAEPELREAFREGWVELHERAQGRRPQLEELFEERIFREPYLVIGTSSYRRAFASIDAADVLERVDLDPVEALDSWMVQ